MKYSKNKNISVLASLIIKRYSISCLLHYIVNKLLLKGSLINLNNQLKIN